MSAPPPAPPPPPPPAICSSSLRPRGPQARPPEINLDAFFETCFGFREDVSDLPGLYARLSVTDGPEGALLSSSANDRTFRCGTFTMKRAGDFKVPTAPAGGGEGATFQVASGFNCLEFISNRESAANGVSKYIHDRTQGPAASISCTPALVYRNYFLPHGGPDGTEHRGQLQQQISLLADLPIPTDNGYVRLTADALQEMEERGLFEDLEAAFGQARVGLHTDVQVTSGLKAATIEVCTDPEQMVNQVFVSAANLAHVRPALAGDPRIEGLARLLLRVAYRLTILAGAENAARQAARADRPGRRRLFLTLVGCGVFGNDPHWVCEALGENEALIRQSGLDVVLGVFDGRLLPRDVRQDLEGLARSMGGTVTKVK